MLDKTHFQHQLFRENFLTFSLPYPGLLRYLIRMTEVVETQHGVLLSKRERVREGQISC